MTNEADYTDAVASLNKVTALLRVERRRLTVLRWVFTVAVSLNIGGALWNISTALT